MALCSQPAFPTLGIWKVIDSRVSGEREMFEGRLILQVCLFILDKIFSLITVGIQIINVGKAGNPVSPLFLHCKYIKKLRKQNSQ